VLEEGSLVLAIDDDPAVLTLLKRYLSKLGYQVEIAASGEEGLRMARNFLPDIIILDVMMPRMDGWEVLSYLKADHKLADIPVIVLSMIEDKSMGYSLGATDYLIKPISREQLTVVLQKYQFSQHTTNRLILIIDDDAVSRDMIGRMLRKGGWKVSKADGARVALNSIQKTQPDLILSDLQMPEMDGFEFITKLYKTYPMIPIIVITAEDLTVEDRLRLKECNVSAIFQKGSYDREELLAEVRRVMGDG
jgi:CheY-like chemotaxis protein